MKTYRKKSQSSLCLFGIHFRIFVAGVLAGLALSQPALATIDVLVFSDDGAPREVAKLNGIPGISAVGTSNLDDINSANLANFDVFYAGSIFEDLLDPKASVIQSFLSSGGGVVVGQANVEGAIDWLPSGLGATVADRFYPSVPSFVLTPLGSIHPIFEGLDSNDIGSGPLDKIYCSDLEPGWDVLMMYSTSSDLLRMAAGTYGDGRILLWPDRYDTNIPGQLFSDQFVKQAYEWVAIPEPTTIALMGIGGLLIRRSKKFNKKRE